MFLIFRLVSLLFKFGSEFHHIMNLFKNMNKFFHFNELVELGKIFMDCKAYLIALEHFDKALEYS